MSNITFKGPKEADSFVLSLWFRVPKESMDKARKEYQDFLKAQDEADDALQLPPLCGIVPLMTFGPKGNKLMSFEQFATDETHTNTSIFHRWSGQPTCAWVADPPDVQTFHFADYRTKDLHLTEDTSYIGVDCRSKKNILTYNLWYVSNAKNGTADKQPEIKEVAKEVSGGGSTPDPLLIYSTPNASFPIDCPNRPATVFRPSGDGFLEYPAPYYDAILTSIYGNDFSEKFLCMVPEALAAVPLEGHWLVNFQGNMYSNFPAPDDYKAGTEVKADHWHHIIMSVENDVISTEGTAENHGGDIDLFELDNGIVHSSVEMFISFDDKNLTGKKLSYFIDGKDSDNGNLIMPPNAYVVFNYLRDTYYNLNEIGDSGLGYNITVVSQGRDKPATYKFDPPPFPIGDIHIPGDSITTKHVEMAELQIFVDAHLDTSVEDNRRLFITKEGRPAPIGKAKKFFDKKPEVLLHLATNWKVGKNTGSLADDPPKKGDHVGEIKVYHPNPSLYGKQDDKKK